MSATWANGCWRTRMPAAAAPSGLRDSRLDRMGFQDSEIVSSAVEHCPSTWRLAIAANGQ